MSNIIPFNFKAQEIRVVQDDLGDTLFVARDAAAALGYKDPTSAIKQHCRGVAIHHPIPDRLGRVQDARVIRESDLYRLIVKSDLPSAVEFEKVVFEYILPSIRKTGGYHVQQVDQPLQPAMPEIQIAEAAGRMLRMSDTSKLRMLDALCAEIGVSSGFLPDYTDEPNTVALGDLLKKHGSKLSARAANVILMDMGYLEEKERRSSGGSVKKFKSITEAGLKYGKNETSKQNPNQTQPRYWEDSFSALLEEIETYVARLTA
jgi:prophage antirepressor-like protein